MDEQSEEAKRRIVAKRKEPKAAIVAPAPATLREVRELFGRYANEVNSSDLSDSSKAMYIDFANCFVRWMYGGFKPGMRKPDKPHSNIVR
jgi:hypothetical protein